MEPIMKSINQTARCAIIYRNQTLEAYGLQDHQHAYIIHVCQTPGISQEILSQHINVNKSNVARQLLQLEKRGLIYRDYAPNNRKQLCVYPTESCLSIYPKVKEHLIKWQNYLLEDFSDDEKKILCEMMSKVMQKAILYTQNPEALK